MVHVAALQNSKIRNLCELALAYILILATIWTSGRAQQVLLFTSAIWIVATTLLLRDKLKFDGLTPLGLERSWWIVAVAAVMAAAAVAMSAQLGTLHLPLGFERQAWRAWGYITFAFVQQFILQDYFLLRLQHLTAKARLAVAIAAVLFSLAHLPNPLLTFATLVSGCIACLLFLRYRDLYALGFAHALLGLTLAFTVPNSVHHRMRVGLGYLTYRPDMHAHSAEPEPPYSVNPSVGDR